MEEGELMELAGVISSPAMQIIAVQKLGFESSDLETLQSETRENQQLMKFKLLIKWKNKNPVDSRKVDIYYTFC